MSKWIFPLLIVATLSGCAFTGANTRTGAALVSSFKESGMATNERGASKTGRSCSTNILGVASVGDGSVEAAKRNGGITKVASVDYDITNILFVYGKACTIVTGE